MTRFWIHEDIGTRPATVEDVSGPDLERMAAAISDEIWTGGDFTEATLQHREECLDAARAAVAAVFGATDEETPDERS